MTIDKARPVLIRPRYKVTPSASVLLGLRKATTDRMWDRFVGSQYSRPKPGG